VPLGASVTPHVDQRGDPLPAQDGQKLGEAPGRVPEREKDRRRHVTDASRARVERNLGKKPGNLTGRGAAATTIRSS
jgi:hypothetical protein